jgi:FKBP-type peptidyl-prolyl cis-trans isomerase FkpA
MNPLTIAGVALVLLPSLLGCSMDAFRKRPPVTLSGEPETLQYAPELQVELGKMTRTSSGLYYLDRLAGSGPMADYGNEVQVAYVGVLADGREFDRSGAGQPIEFTLGAGEVITGWDEGIRGMRVGGRRLLVVRPSLAYGDISPGAGIPANATLVFEVSLEGVSP